jgi:Rps23 Pro-64 3,4-dihydroxylase Tpa1-like proline 4-hydroxylase
MALAQLFNVLDQLDAAHQTMLHWGKSKRTAIMNNQVSELIQINNQESRVLKEILRLEEERVSCCHLFLQEKGIKSALNLNLTELSRLVFDPKDKEILLGKQQQLANSLSELKALNDMNQTLVEQSLQFLDYSMNLFSGVPDQEVTYQPPSGKQVGGSRMGMFDTRA